MITMGRLYAIAVLVGGCSFSLPGSQPAAVDGASQPPPPSDGTSGGLDSVSPDTNGGGGAQTTNHLATEDTWLHSGQPDTSFAGDHFVIPDGSPVAVALMRFDLAALAGTTVSSVELHIWTDFDPGAQVQVFPVTERWSETEATWNQRAAGVAWTSAGAAPPARGTSAIATFTPSPQFTEFVVPFDAATVAGWVAAPDTNFGVVITSVNSDGPKLVSREGAVDDRPFLRITHTP